MRSSQTLEIPLYACDNCYWETLELDFDLGGYLVDLTEVRLRIVGDCGRVMWGCCIDYYPLFRRDAPLLIALHGEAGEPALDEQAHVFDNWPREPMTVEWVFALALPEYDEIADGRGRVVLSDPSQMFFDDQYSCGFICPFDVVCNLESVTLLLKVKSLVANERSTWGGVKALYH